MTAIFVSRHKGAIEWARRQGIDAEVVEHLDLSRVRKGDMVLGTLPIQMVADVNRRGAEYWHLEIDVPRVARGKDLSANELDGYGALLVKYEARRIGSA